VRGVGLSTGQNRDTGISAFLIYETNFLSINFDDNYVV
jgi:hypothetical protein